MAGLGLMLFAIPVLARDYSSYTLEEMAQMAPELKNATIQEKMEFQRAWREKMRNATPAERQKWRGKVCPFGNVPPAGGRGMMNNRGMQQGGMGQGMNSGKAYQQKNQTGGYGPGQHGARHGQGY